MLPDRPPPEGVRDVSATRPGPALEDMRAAYLGVLKLALCDLAGAGTTSVGKTMDGRVFSRRLSGAELAPRITGLDWPRDGLTMVGMARLDDLQQCVEEIVRDEIPGDLVEAGAWRGGASILIRATLDALGADERTLWVMDSFQGFPKPSGDAALDLSEDAFLSIPLEEVREHFDRFGLDRGVSFVRGFFAETMPKMRDGRWSLVRLDGDTYEATRLGLESLYPGLMDGGYLVVDDYSFIEECRRAVDDFRQENGIGEPIEKIDWNGIRWRRASGGPADAGSKPAAEAWSPGEAPAEEPSPVAIPTERELELAARLESLTAELDAARAEISRLRRTPLRRVASRVSGLSR